MFFEGWDHFILDDIFLCKTLKQMIIGILIKCPATFKMTPERCLYYAWKNIEKI